MKAFFMNLTLILSSDIGTTTTNAIAPHWAYNIGGAIFIVLFLVSCGLSYWFYKNKDKYHPVAENSFWDSLKSFWYKNRFLFSIILDVIFLMTSIMFFLIASGSFQ